MLGCVCVCDVLYFDHQQSCWLSSHGYCSVGRVLPICVRWSVVRLSQCAGCLASFVRLRCQGVCAIVARVVSWFDPHNCTEELSVQCSFFCTTATRASPLLHIFICCRLPLTCTKARVTHSFWFLATKQRCLQRLQ